MPGRPLPDGAGRGVTRRGTIKWALTAAQTAVAGLAAAAMAGRAHAAGSPAARPTRGSGRIHLTVSVAFQGAGNYQGTMQQIVDAYLARHWLPSHPGVELTTIAGMGCNG